MSGPKSCSFTNCGRPFRARGLCSGHYQQVRRGQELTPLGETRGDALRISAVTRDGFKVCSNCRREKPFSAFYAWRRHSTGLQAWCKSCMADRDRSHHYQTSYGLTQSDVESMIESQGGLCAICGERPEDRIRLGLVVDHCHETGAVRGMLCSNCNRAIGLFGDRVETVMSATSYLLAHEDALATLGGD